MNFEAQQQGFLSDTLAAYHQGVFSLSDLKNLFSPYDSVMFYRHMRRLERNGVLRRFTRGFYVASEFSLAVLSQRLCDKSYVSFSNVLADKLLIGTIPRHTVSAVKLGKNRRYESDWGRVLHFGSAPRLFFGFEVRNGVAYANPEKAFIDTLYFHLRGHGFGFNIYHDIDMSRLDRKKILAYLKAYRNPKFVRFVKGVLHA